MDSTLSRLKSSPYVFSILLTAQMCVGYCGAFCNSQSECHLFWMKSFPIRRYLQTDVSANHRLPVWMDVPSHAFCGSRVMRQLTKYTVERTGNDLDHTARRVQAVNHSASRVLSINTTWTFLPPFTDAAAVRKRVQPFNQVLSSCHMSETKPFIMKYYDTKKPILSVEKFDLRCDSWIERSEYC